MISVAMATYNGEKYIKQQIDSIFKQSLPIDELVIFDDASTDSTANIIKSYHDKRIHFYKNTKNQGYINNFFKAIESTHGDIIFLADQDDIWEKEKVEIMVSILNTKDCVTLCSASSIIDSHGQIIEKIHILDFFKNRRHINTIEKITFEQLLFQNVAQGCTYCFKKSVKDYYIKIHDENIIHDCQLMIISSLIGTVYYLHVPLIQYRIHDKNALAFNINIKIQKPSRKPKILCFILKIDKIVHIHWSKKLYAYFVCYLRLPFLKVIFSQIFGDKNA